jgi:5-methylcytosine-specific restriction endonuclease McrA
MDRSQVIRAALASGRRRGPLLDALVAAATPPAPPSYEDLLRAASAAQRVQAAGPSVRASCGICGEPIYGAFRHPHPRSYSVDHITPVSKGGSWAPWNLRPAHLGCNQRKGARVPEGVAAAGRVVARVRRKNAAAVARRLP